MSNKILFTGATGYIGGSVLSRILEHPNRDTFDITILLRSPEKSKAFESFGVNVLIGSMDDQDFLERTVAQFDIVIQNAKDNPDSIRPILKGLKHRFEETKNVPVLIHTSGTGILIDNALGEYAGDNICSDLDVAKIDAIPLSAPHRETDTAIIEASKQGYVKTYIVYPSTVWGRPTHKFAVPTAATATTCKSLSKIISVQIPALIGASYIRGATPCVGQGKNIWSHVHIDETADFYYKLFDAVLSNQTHLPNGPDGHYFLENGEYVMYDLAKTIAVALHASGQIKSDEPVPFSAEELANIRSAWKFGTNSRARGDRSRSLGWNPTKTTAEMLADVPEEIKVFFKLRALASEAITTSITNEQLYTTFSRFREEST